MHAYGKVFAAAAAAIIIAGPAFAGGSHKGGHYTFGEPGNAAEVTRTVEVIADDSDGLGFKMDLLAVKQGETIRFVVTNKGTGPHEFSIGDTASQRAHAKLMRSNPDMKHGDDPSAVTLAPGETKEIIWKFSKPIQGQIVFACQMPGHYEAGMVRTAKLEKAKRAS